MSQPCDRGAKINLPNRLDSSLKEFWTENPWDIVGEGHNLSMLERDRFWMNIKGKRFLEMSFLSGMDSDGDGRAVVAADFRNCGQLDVLVRHIGGGSVNLFENHTAKKHYLSVSLRGVKSNKQGIGARLVAKANGQQIVRELYPSNSFQSQMPARVHFGLGDAVQIDQLAVLWPSGQLQQLTNIKGDRHVVITEGTEGAAAIEEVVPGKTIAP